MVVRDESERQIRCTAQFTGDDMNGLLNRGAQIRLFGHCGSKRHILIRSIDKTRNSSHLARSEPATLTRTDTDVQASGRGSLLLTVFPQT